jgi:hypothetical protein
MSGKGREKPEDLWGILQHPLIAKGPTAPSGEDVDDEVVQVPSQLPILPLRGLVVFPMTAVPIRVGQPRSVRQP